MPHVGSSSTVDEKSSPQLGQASNREDKSIGHGSIHTGSDKKLPSLGSNQQSFGGIKTSTQMQGPYLNTQSFENVSTAI